MGKITLAYTNGQRNALVSHINRETKNISGAWAVRAARERARDEHEKLYPTVEEQPLSAFATEEEVRILARFGFKPIIGNHPHHRMYGYKDGDYENIGIRNVLNKRRADATPEVPEFEFDSGTIAQDFDRAIDTLKSRAIRCNTQSEHNDIVTSLEDLLKGIR